MWNNVRFYHDRSGMNGEKPTRWVAPFINIMCVELVRKDISKKVKLRH